MGGILVATACSGAAGPPTIAEDALGTVVTTVAPPVEPAAPPAPPGPPGPQSLPAPPGPQTPLAIVGTTVALVDRSRPTVSKGRTISPTRALPTRVWHPAEGGPWPLVVFAHGFSVGPDPYVALCRTWATAGYVVAAPEFPLTDADVAGTALDEYDIDNQPDDVRFVLDALVASTSPVAARVDRTRLGVAGHSDGGVTALAVAADPPAGLKGVIAMSAQPVAAGPHATPVLVVHGDADGIAPYAEGKAVYEEAVAPRYLLTLLGGEHLEPFLAGSDWLDIVDRAAVDFLDRYVAGRTASTATLLADGEPGLAVIRADP